MELYRSGAELNHVPCQFKFGYLHEMIGDYVVASEYYQKAAAQDFSPAQHHLALLYLNGKAFPPPSSASSPADAANSLLLSSALRDYPPSHFILATELQHEPSTHLEKAAALRYEPALLKLKRSRDGSIWSETDCAALNQPDFPFLVPLVVASPQSCSEEAKGETSRGYALVSSGETDVALGTSPLEIVSPKGSELPKPTEDHPHYFHHLLVCFSLCCASVVLLVASVFEDWGETSSNQRRHLSSVPWVSHSSTEKRSLRVGLPLPDPQDEQMISVHSDSSLSTRRLSPSVSWPSYLSVPGETVLTLCPGHTLDVSMCSTSLDSNIACSGDPVLTLLDSSGSSTFASDDDYCGLCPSLLYSVSASTSCSDYVLSASCSSGNCSGKALLTVTTSTCSQTFPDTLSSSSNSYSVLSCSLLQNNQDSLSDMEGPGTMLSGGSVRDQCELVGSGFGGSSYSSSWSSTAADRRFYFCSDEEDRPAVSLLAGALDKSDGLINGIGTNALFHVPWGVSLSSTESFALVADSDNNMIRKIIMSSSAVSLLAGSASGFSGTTNAIGTSARFNGPTSISLPPDDSYALVADTKNNQIRKIVMSTSAVSFVAGAGPSSSGYSNGIGTSAQFYRPSGISQSSDGSFALVADTFNNQIRKIVMSTSAVSLLAGKRSSGYSNGIGTYAEFYSPSAVYLSSDDTYALVTDRENNQIRKIVMSTSAVSLFAGATTPNFHRRTSNGIGTNAQFSGPWGISLSSDDSFALVADSSNYQIRKIVISTSEVSLLAGAVDGSRGTSNGIGTNARFRFPAGISLSSDDSYALVADVWVNMIRKIVISSPAPIGTATGYSPFLPKDTSPLVSVSLAFIILALLLVVIRMLLTRPSAGRQLKLFAVWWWMGYLCCCAFSIVCAVVAVASYAFALSGESQVSQLVFSILYLCHSLPFSLSGHSLCRVDTRWGSISALFPFSLRLELYLLPQHSFSVPVGG
jgi:hypothetical protein